MLVLMKKYILLVLVGSVVSLHGNRSLAQVPATLQTIQPKVDSLTALLDHAEGKDRYIVLRDIAYEYYDIDNELGLEFIKQANTLSLQLGDSMDIVHSTRMLGQLLRRTGRNREGIKALLGAFDLAKKIQFEHEELRIALSLSLAYLRTARFDSSLRFSYHAFRGRMKRGEHLEVGYIWGNVGLLYYKLGHFEEAIRYYEKSRHAYQQVGEALPSYYLTNIAFCQMRMGRHIEARTTLDQWQTNCANGKCGAYDSLQWVFAEGVLKFLGGQLRQSLPWFKEGLRRAEEIGDGPLKMGGREYIARCLLAEKDFRQAKVFLEEATELAIRGGDDYMLVDLYEYLIVVSKEEGDLERVRLLQGKLIETTRRVFNEKVLHTVAVARVEFEEYENQLLIEKQAEVLGLNEEAIQRHRLLILLSTGLVIVLLMFVFVLVRFNRFQKMISRDLDKRVFDRTKELEASEKVLKATLGEQKSLLNLLSSRMRASMATVTGLRNLVHLNGADLARTVDGFDNVAVELHQLCRFIDLAKDSEPRISRTDAVTAHRNGHHLQ
jgi:tetratricopeptide (TPR) repeat protein